MYHSPLHPRLFQGINPQKLQPLTPTLQSLLAKDTELKEFGQGALKAYIRAYHLAGNPQLFDVHTLPLDSLAYSYGLLTVPQLMSKKMRREQQSKAAATEPATVAAEQPKG